MNPNKVFIEFSYERPKQEIEVAKVEFVGNLAVFEQILDERSSHIWAIPLRHIKSITLNNETIYQNTKGGN